MLMVCVDPMKKILLLICCYIRLIILLLLSVKPKPERHRVMYGKKPESSNPGTSAALKQEPGKLQPTSNLYIFTVSPVLVSLWTLWAHVCRVW